jgi:hypothetical protein
MEAWRAEMPPWSSWATKHITVLPGTGDQKRPTNNNASTGDGDGVDRAREMAEQHWRGMILLWYELPSIAKQTIWNDTTTKHGLYIYL